VSLFKPLKIPLWMIPWLSENLLTSSHLYNNQMVKIGSWAKKKKKPIDPIDIRPPYFSQVFKILCTLSNRFSWN
jgi:hypothetical protein